MSATSGASNVYAEIVSPNGSVVATGSYDTKSAGNYGINVCSYYDDENPPTMQWTGVYATGPAGQPALPVSQGGGQGGVLGTTTTLSHGVHGSGAIRTRAGLAWFSVRLDRGLGIVKVYDPLLRKHFLFTHAKVSFGTNTVRMTQGGMTLMLSERGSNSRITFHSSRFRASGKVVRNGFLIV